MAPKLLEIDEDKLHMKFSAYGIDFDSQSFNRLGWTSQIWVCLPPSKMH